MARRVRNTSPDRLATPPVAPHPVGTLAQQLAAVHKAWTAQGAHSAQSLARMGETTHRFARRLSTLGVSSFVDVTPEDAQAFITAATQSGGSAEVATQHARRTAIRTLYRTLRSLDYLVGDPTLDITLPPRGLLAARPLNDDEITLCRASAQLARGRWAPMRAVAWALGEATAVSSEISAVTLADLDDPAAPTRVHLPGTTRHDPRRAELTVWGQRIIASRITYLRSNEARPTTLLAYGGQAPPGGAKAQASVCNALRDVLDAAGLARESDVRPSSLRHWAARSAYESGKPIETVARLMGNRSLDATAEDIALDW